MKDKKYIVIESGSGRPMAFADDQFCYAPPKKQHRGRPLNFMLETYTEEEAKELMQLSRDFRSRNGFSLTEYQLMPIKI